MYLEDALAFLHTAQHQSQAAIERNAVRGAICKQTYKYSTRKHCPSCEKRTPCFAMTDDALKMIEGFRLNRLSTNN